MTTITPTTLHGPEAAQLAAQIAIPTRLPTTYKGTPLTHLSHSAVTRYRLCPEDFRRSYILGQWGPTSGEQFLGSRVDDAITGYYQQQLDGQTLDLSQLCDLFNDRWKQQLDHELDRNGAIDWPAEMPASAAHQLGLQALELTLQRLVPKLGRPLAVQRRFEFKLHPALEWSIVGVVDLDTARQQTVFVTEDGQPHPFIHDQGDPEPTVELPYLQAPAELRHPVKQGRTQLAPQEAIDAYHRACERYRTALAIHQSNPASDGEPPTPPLPLPDVRVPVHRLAAQTVKREVTGIVDYKVKGSLLSDSSAARDMQAGLYLAERWLHAQPAFDFRFAQVAKPKPGRRVNMTTSLVATQRTERDLRRLLARFGQTAASIWATYAQFGPDRPWGYATQEWKCDYCNHGPRGTSTCPFAPATS